MNEIQQANAEYHMREINEEWTDATVNHLRVIRMMLKSGEIPVTDNLKTAWNNYITEWLVMSEAFAKEFGGEVSNFSSAEVLSLWLLK